VIERVEKSAFNRGVADSDKRFDSMIEVSWHEICRPDVDDRFVRRSAIAEGVHAGMFEIAANEGTNPNVLRQARNTGPQTAHASDNAIDLHASLACLVELGDHPAVDKRVHLYDDPAMLRRHFVFDELFDTGTQRSRGNE